MMVSIAAPRPLLGLKTLIADNHANAIPVLVRAGFDVQSIGVNLKQSFAT
jgi:hypothetical protein